jgi:hypothetical protein
MANSIANAPAILAESVIASLKGKLPALRAFSSVFTAAESGAGKTVQVPLIGVSTATEFGASGYLTQDYGAQFLSNAFVPTAANALAEKCLAEIGALITNANYSSNVDTGAALTYAEVVTAKGVLDAAKAAEPRAFILNPTYANGLLGDATIIGNSVLGAGILTSGQIGTLAGAAVYQWNSLPTNSENLAGFACGADAIAVASALPMSEIPGFEVANAVDADTGLGVQVLMGQEQSGYYNVTATLLFGAAVGRATSLHRLKTA